MQQRKQNVIALSVVVIAIMAFFSGYFSSIAIQGDPQLQSRRAGIFVAASLEFIRFAAIYVLYVAAGDSGFFKRFINVASYLTIFIFSVLLFRMIKQAFVIENISLSIFVDGQTNHFTSAQFGGVVGGFITLTIFCAAMIVISHAKNRKRLLSQAIDKESKFISS